MEIALKSVLAAFCVAVVFVSIRVTKSISRRSQRLAISTMFVGLGLLAVGAIGLSSGTLLGSMSSLVGMAVTAGSIASIKRKSKLIGLSAVASLLYSTTESGMVGCFCAIYAIGTFVGLVSTMTAGRMRSHVNAVRQHVDVLWLYTTDTLRGYLTNVVRK
jgi:hypothetical protein